MTRYQLSFSLVAIAAAALLIAGCGSEGGNDGEWNIQPDASTDAPEPPPDDAGDTGDTPPDAGDYCEAQRAFGEGACRAVVGVKFNGYGCVRMYGCRCEGPDCDDTFGSIDFCETQYTEYNQCQWRDPVCEGHPELSSGQGGGGSGAGDGGDEGAACPPMYAWDGGHQCVAVTSTCRYECLTETPPSYCDHVFLTEVSCRQVHQDVCLEGTCEAQDISGEGACSAVVGWRFDGRECHSFSGCSCTGPDCDQMYSSKDECQHATAHCGS